MGVSDLKACRVSAVYCHRRSVLPALAGLLAIAAAPRRGWAQALPFAAAGPAPEALRALHLSDVSLPDVDGAPAPLGVLAGRPVLLHFFATWCDVCRDELPLLAALAGRPQGPGLYLVSLAEPPGRVRRYMAELGLRWPVQIDVDRRLSRRLGVAALPTTIVLDPALRPASIVQGEADWSASGVTEWLAAVASSPTSSIHETRQQESAKP